MFFLNNMLPKHRLVTCSLVFRSTLRRSESLLKQGWTPEEGFLGAPEPNIRGPTGLQKSKISFRGEQQTIFMDLSIGNHFLRMYYTESLLLMFPKGGLSIPLARLSVPPFKNRHLKVIYCTKTQV